MKIPKTVIYLLLIFILAFALRLISAYYVDIGSDEMIYSLIPLNIISAGRLSTVEQAPLYFYLTDLGYKLTGGLTLVSTRLPSIFFGALAVLLVFLISQELFENKKASYLSSFLFAISGYAIRNNQEMDMTAYFFALLSVFFFIQFLNKENHKQIYLSALFLSLGVITKPIVLVFVPAYAVTWLIKWSASHYHHHHQHQEQTRNLSINKSNKNSSSAIILSLLLCLLIVSPVLIYNYLLFKEKGMTDYYFTVLAGVGNGGVYQGQEANPWTVSRSLGFFWSMFTGPQPRYDFMILLFGLVGLFAGWKTGKASTKQGTVLFLLTLAMLVFYLGGIMGSSTHYVWIPLVLSIFAGYGIVQAQEYLTTRFQSKPALVKHFLTAIILLSVMNTAIVFHEIVPLKKTSFAITLQEYAQENIAQDAIVVLDPRIYRGVFAWAFHDWHYLEGTYFPKLTEAIQKSPGPKQNIPLYYIECGPGTFCGWKPEDFNRIYDFGEQLSTVFRQQASKIAELNAIDTFIVYKSSIAAPFSIYETIDRTHSHWYTPVGWKYTENAVDNYTAKTVFDKALNGVGFFILYLDVLIALLSPVLVFFLLGKRSD